MKIAILHYHLKPGGVTTVIQHQVEALKKDCKLLVLSGSPPSLPLPVPTQHIPGIGYQNDANPAQDPQEVAQEIHRAIRNQWSKGCDLLHVHNPFLAKNSAFLDILKALQERGIPLFLQIHDFAEDGRPHAYFRGSYPHDCHYGVINSRDYQILLKAGLKPQGLHKVFSPVRPLDITSRPSPGEREILYPVRAIRRKNIGEAILLSLYLKSNPTLSITLPPNSPVDIAAYKDWEKFALQNRLNIRFESGLDHDFAELVNSAQFLLTTSMTEGFGYTFLEAWTAGKLVWGRDLADITSDFKRKGLWLDHLYQKLLVPLSWIDSHCFFTRWKDCILENSAHFGLHLEKEAIEIMTQKMLDDGCIDFGLLDESFQKQVLNTLLAEPEKRNRLAEINPFLKNPAISVGNHERISHNRQIVSNEFNVGVYRENLLKTYQAVLRDTVKQRIDKHCLAASFFNLDSFSLLKWGRYVG